MDRCSNLNADKIVRAPEHVSCTRRAVLRSILLALAVLLVAGVPLATPALAPPAAYPELGPGLEYAHTRSGRIPWSIHTLQVDRSARNLRLISSLAADAIFDLGTVSEQVQSLPKALGRPVAAINGDFFVINRGPYQGDPRGLHIVQGELVSGPSGGPCFWMDAAGQPQMGEVRSRFVVRWPDGTMIPFGLNEERSNLGAVLYTPRLGPTTRTQDGVDLVLESSGTGPWLPLRSGQEYVARVREVREVSAPCDTPLLADTLVLSLGPELAATLPPVSGGMTLCLATATAPELSQVRTAIGGGPLLVVHGQVRTWCPPQPRHPRTAIGWNDQRIIFLVVDGRQPGLSAGMTFPELAAQMQALGCQHALNLDGGGSSTLWLGGQVVNSPSDGRERKVANALILLRRRAAP